MAGEPFVEVDTQGMPLLIVNPSSGAAVAIEVADEDEPGSAPQGADTEDGGTTEQA